MSDRPQPFSYRISVWADDRWKIVNQKTRDPMQVVRKLESNGWDRRLILIERRPGRFIPMPPPDAPAPIIMAGKVVSA